RSIKHAYILGEGRICIDFSHGDEAKQVLQCNKCEFPRAGLTRPRQRCQFGTYPILLPGSRGVERAETSGRIVVRCYSPTIHATRTKLGATRADRPMRACPGPCVADSKESETMAGGVAAVVVAAGRGLRAGGGAPKQYRAVRGSPVIRHSLCSFIDHPEIEM